MEIIWLLLVGYWLFSGFPHSQIDIMFIITLKLEQQEKGRRLSPEINAGLVVLV